MGRSLKKGPFVDHHLRAKFEKMNREGAKKLIKTWSRRSMIIPEMVGHTFEVHNGRKFITVFVSEKNNEIVVETKKDPTGGRARKIKSPIRVRARSSV